MLAADCIVDIGPGAGEHGGEVIAVGTAQEIMENQELHHRSLSERQASRYRFPKRENSLTGYLQK